MKQSLFLVGMTTMFLIACQNNSERSKQGEGTVKDQATINHPDNESAGQSNAVVLNNGVRWIANSETKEGIDTMKAMIKDFSDKSDLKDYHLLKLKLENEFTLILQKCTMTGEAHTQLHNYLLPMKEMFIKLNSTEIDICREALNKLKHHLSEFENYFQ